MSLTSSCIIFLVYIMMLLNFVIQNIRMIDAISIVGESQSSGSKLVV